MARISTRVKGYTKGKAEKGYWGEQGLKDLLHDIHITHKSWDNGWYELASIGFYESAKLLLVVKAQGEFRNKALDIIDELIEIGGNK